MIDLDPIVATVEAVVASHRLDGPGRYARWTRLDGPGHRELGINPYGCADAANLLYTVGRFPEQEERSHWIDALRSFQDPPTGLFQEGSHHPIHTTAHCIAALELFDAGPEHELTELAPLRDASAMEGFLDGLDWRGEPWTEAHRGAGLYAALLLAGEVSDEWQERYFVWLESRFDPGTGLLRQGCMEPLPAGLPLVFPHLAGTFHYLFNMEHAGRRLPHAEALIDTCLALRTERAFPLAAQVWFADVDWVYCLSRALRQCDHRHSESMDALLGFASDFVDMLAARDPETDEGLDDLHRLFGSVCALAELQQCLPGELESERSLRLVLDRRPFI